MQSPASPIRYGTCELFHAGRDFVAPRKTRGPVPRPVAEKKAVTPELPSARHSLLGWDKATPRRQWSLAGIILGMNRVTRFRGCLALVLMTVSAGCTGGHPSGPTGAPSVNPPSPSPADIDPSYKLVLDRSLRGKPYPFINAYVLQNRDAVQRNWERMTGGGAVPPTDFESQAFLIVIAGQSSSCPVQLERFEVNRSHQLVSVKTRQASARMYCTDDVQPHVFVFAGPRSELTSTGLQAQINDGPAFAVQLQP